MTRLFVFGTLLDDALRARVAGIDTTGTVAKLSDHAVRRAEGADFPALIRSPGASVTGRVFDFDDTAMARLDFYEAGFGFAPERVTVDVDDRPTGATVYRPTGTVAASDAPWDLAAWRAQWGALTRTAAIESMGCFGRIDGAELRGRVPTIFARAASALRAGTEPMPTTLRSDTHRDRIDVVDDRRPYTHFFRVDETDLRHPTFGGGSSATLTRAGFVMSDAVTVLPYDPVRDRVLLVEQFRFGPFARGDLHPWTLEPIAGRVDPGEEPDTTARREAMEEAHLPLGDLLFIGSHYVSPGAVTEYLYCYVGLCDLPDDAAGLGGKKDEHEDIRAHVIPFDRLCDLMDSGEVDNGPLAFTALWLDRERRRGRFA